MILSTLASVLFVSHFLVSGFLIARRLFGTEEEHPAEYWLPVAFMLGLVYHAVVQMLALGILGSVSNVGYGAALVVLAVLSFLPFGRQAPLSVFGGFSLLNGPANPRMRVLYWVLAGWLLLNVSAAFYNGMSYPQLSYDGRAIWNLKAKIFFHEGNILNEIFLDRFRVHYHADYPILVPLTQSTLFRLLGDTEFPGWRLIYTSTYLFLLLFVYQAVARFGSRTAGLFVALLIGSVPFREMWVTYHSGVMNAGEADYTLAFFALVTFYSAFLWWQTRDRQHLLLASIGCAAALMTKKEGIIIFALLLCIQGFEWLVSSNKKTRMLAILGGLGLALLLALPWFRIAGSLPNHYDEDFASMVTMDFVLQMWRRLDAIWWMFRYEVSDFEKFSFAWIVLPVVVLVNGLSGRYRYRSVRYFDVLILGWLAAYTIVYCLSPLNLRFHLATSVHRLLWHLHPVLMVNLGVQGVLLGTVLLRGEALKSSCGDPFVEVSRPEP